MDDETLGNGSVTFEVWADGARLYASPTLTGAGAAIDVSVPLSGQNSLQLLVGGGTNIFSDHADWAAASVTCP